MKSPVSRFLFVVLASAALLSAAGCGVADLPDERTSPGVFLSTPDVPLEKNDCGAVPHVLEDEARAEGLPGTAARMAPWEVVLRYPPEVERVVRERWERERRYRDREPTVVFLNFDGVTIKKGNDSNALTNTSWVPNVSTATVTIPPFNASPWGSNRSSVITYIVTHLEELFAGYNVSFTTTRPSSGNYMMTVIGGSHATIGMEYGVLGVSPLDCAPGENLNLNPIDINFIFTESLADFRMGLQDVVYTIAHENAHTYGLAHINRTQDIMYYASAGGMTLSWGAASTRAGEQNCSTNNYQDDRLYLTKAVGGGGVNPETKPPTVSITSPRNGSVQGSSFDVKIAAYDESGVQRVELYVNGTLKNWSAESQVTFSLFGLSDGEYELQAKAKDYYENVGSSEIVRVTVGAPPPPQGCQSDADCGPRKKCQDTVCVDLPPPPTGGALGADCKANEDCQSGWCIFGEQNYCTAPCNEASGLYCPAGYFCKPDGFCLSVTDIPPGAVGAPCTANEECRTGICVDGGSDGYCSAVCDPQGTPCPAGAACVEAGDGQTFICGRPPTQSSDGGTDKDDGEGGGCSAAPTRSRGAVWLGLVAACLALGRRRSPAGERRYKTNCGT